MIPIIYLAPEIILSLSIFSLLIIGVFIRNSFDLIYRLSIFLVFLLILIIISDDGESIKIFNESFVLDELSSRQALTTRRRSCNAAGTVLVEVRGPSPHAPAWSV